MKVHLIKKQSIENYVRQNAAAKAAFNTWLSTIRFAEWDAPKDITATFNSADLLGNHSKRVVFNIGGNNYRMICTYNFGKQMAHLFINWIGTHAEYSKLCIRNHQYEVNNF